MNPAKLIELQQQVRLNQAEMQDSFKDLDSWVSEIKEKEQSLQSGGDRGTEKLPPIRNSLQRKKKKKKIKKNDDEAAAKPRRIRGYDFKAWDKFDANKACEEIDEQSSEESEYETDEEWEEIRRKQQAIVLKDQGNQYLKEGNLEAAVQCYSQGIGYDQENFLLPANRAMAYLKLERYEAAESDCTAAIALDPTYVKSYHRRATARVALKKYKEAESDFQKVLSLDPKNRLAKSELKKLDELMNAPKFSVSADGDAGIVKPVYKPPDQRSKKPLRRLVIEEVGSVEEKKPTEAPSPSETKKKIITKDYEEFEKFMQDKKNKSEVASNGGHVDMKGGDSTVLKTPTSPADICTAPAVQETRAATTDNHATDTSATDSQKKHDRDLGAVEQQFRVPDIPATSYHFQADWKILKDTSKPFYEYLRRIEPSLLPKLMGQFLDAAILMKILRTLRDFYIADDVDVLPVLEHLSRVKRFGMIVMFLSADDKQVISDLFTHVKDKIQPDTLKKLQNLYEV